ncbi:DUF559 domain-containing protein [Granulicoccus sp. GXG6511]|uniref:DUF559 domain-containing protein n=1 Tax=Granulicoccus sp. GXG6511 TaxID=3381351 RepID=UPI003D7D2670
MEILLEEHHGVVSTAQLLALGIDSEEIRRLVAVEALRPLRRGWYAGADADPTVERAVKLGGALSCVSALRLHDFWAPGKWPNRNLHIRRTRHFHGVKLPKDVTGCRVPGHTEATVKRSVDPMGTALACAVGCLPAEAAVTLMDSALNKQLYSPEELRALIQPLPWRASRLLERVDPGAESGTESLVRHRLLVLGVKFRTQVHIGDVGRVDLLIGDRLVIEVDSKAYHSDSDAFHNDRRRDRRLVAMGYLVIRLTYEDVMNNWTSIEPDLLAVIRERRHLWPRQR